MTVVLEASSALVDKLEAEGTPFVRVTVVRAQAPAPARAGDTAVVLADGTVAGFVGGHCVEASVRAAAEEVLDGGSPLLLRVLPGRTDAFPDVPGARVVANPCLSGGALELFLEPHLPAPVIAVAGETPIGRAVARLAASLGYEAYTGPSLAGHPPVGARAAVVASHGHDEPESIRAALDAGVPFVALVASRRRGAAVLDAMGLPDDERARVHTPAGLDIGARTPAEVALSILAQVVQAVRTRPDRSTSARAPRPAPHAEPAPGRGGPRQAIDPVCGMVVATGTGTPHRVVDGRDLWFCSPRCRDTYVG